MLMLNYKIFVGFVLAPVFKNNRRDVSVNLHSEKSRILMYGLSKNDF